MAYATREQRRDNPSDQAASVAKTLQDAGQAARRMATDGVEQVRETASEYWDQGRAKAEELTESLQTNVRDRPMAAILIAAGIGFLLGVACASRR
jgi:ElaB/YqjD/DUF883 family membrane-anchored ribosome-binding protein